MLKQWLGKLTDITAYSDRYFSKAEKDIFARTLYGEAKDYSYEAKIAIASVIQNRVKISKKFRGYWWGNNIVAVCHKMGQFSCWDRNNQEYFEMIRVTKEDSRFFDCIEIVEQVLNEDIGCITRGATHYHDYNMFPYRPAWLDNREPVFSIDGLEFYKLITI